MRRLFLYTIFFLLLVFIAPALAHLAVWSAQNKPTSWSTADWSSADILPKRPDINSAQIFVFSARTGGLKGAFATHSWIVLKKSDSPRYDRYDVVGWGRPLRRNGYAADARWYSNRPKIGKVIEGEEAKRLIPKIEAAIAGYRWQNHGDYTLWPGPNSNTFVAAILRAVPELQAATVSTAVGRDFPEDGKFVGQRKDGSFFVSANGYVGVNIGRRIGLEINFLGLVAGLNPFGRTIKIPAFGSYHF